MVSRLGKAINREVAAEHGLPYSAVWEARTVRGVPAYGHRENKMDSPHGHKARQSV